MDDWSSALVARGPTLSPDGSKHAGSVHVVNVDSLQTARSFAFAEPYAQAGWYASVTVLPMVSCIEGTMWDRPRPEPEQPSAFVTASWQPIGLERSLADLLREEFTRGGQPWLFGGLVLSDDLTEVCGLLGALDLAPQDADRQLTRLIDRTPAPPPLVEAQRWMRGGRPTE